jgi:hypothetical protein
MFELAQADHTTLLHLRAQRGHYAKCRELIANGMDANALDSFGCTPLTEVLLKLSMIEWGGIVMTPARSHAYQESLRMTFAVLVRGGASLEVAADIHIPEALSDPKYRAMVDHARMVGITPRSTVQSVASLRL